MKNENAIYMYIKKDMLDIDKIIDDFSGYLYTIIQNSANFQKEDKEIFYEYYFYSRKIKEIATINNISESKVKVILHRTRNKLRKELLKGGYGFNG